MPHLSPMNWMLPPALFLMCLLPILISLFWWNQTPIFPKMYDSSTSKFMTNWHWY
uniref:ATP synthase F0 subunit 8 n=1 Tax=Neoamphitrite affinis TaxID=2716569 RepID=A0A8F9RSM9_9ANNE|nr:ATP synthase F0 subunit 8 [Neoamphitrite affinis]